MADGVSAVWPAKDIAYVAIVGSVMLAAVFEWVLWLLAFLYCLIKVYQKAENVSTKILAIIMMIIFVLLRLIFLPIMIVTLPLPGQVVRRFPHAAVSFLQWFAFWTFSGLLIIPWLLCIYQLVTHSLGRTKRIKEILDEINAPKVVIVMPCYKEVPDILVRTVDSIVDCDYPSTCIHVFLSFDGDQEDDLYLNTIEKLGVPLIRRSGFPTSIDVSYRGARITISRFPHGGKRHCQKKTFKLIDKVYTEYLKVNDNLFVLFIDSDCILDKTCIQNFMYEMELKPGSKHNMLAMTGVITATTEKNTLLTLLQDIEYIHGQLFERSVESGCGAVTCLPGALTILRFSAFRKLAKYYFSDKAEQCDDLFDYGKCHLGEDRWLTHLFMIASESRYQIGLSTGAFCKTEAVQTYKSLLKQRRRWFLGFITNEVCMLTDYRLWRRYPFLCLIRLAQNTIRTTALLFFVMVIALISTSQTINQLPVGFIAVSLGLNWFLMAYFATNLGRYKILLYPILFVIGPFFNWLYMVYGIFTAGQRTWGGPRADAAHADATTTVQAAIEHAMATGDDLNLVPETFRPALQSQALAQGVQAPHVTLQPGHQFEGRFRSLSRPWDAFLGGNHDPEDPPNNHGQSLQRRMTVPLHVPLHPRNSFDSTFSMSSAGHSIQFPRRTESIAALDLDEPSSSGVNMARSRSPLQFKEPGSKNRAHPPSASSAMAAWRLSQSQLDLAGARRSRPYTRESSANSSVSSLDFTSMDRERSRSRPRHSWTASDHLAGDLAVPSYSGRSRSRARSSSGRSESIPMVTLTRPPPLPVTPGWDLPSTSLGQHLIAGRSRSSLRDPFETDSEFEGEAESSSTHRGRVRLVDPESQTARVAGIEYGSAEQGQSTAEQAQSQSSASAGGGSPSQAREESRRRNNLRRVKKVLRDRIE